MTSRIPEPADPFEGDGLPVGEDGLSGKILTGDAQDGIVPPADHAFAVDDFGTTAREMAEGEPLADRLDREEPDVLADIDSPADEGEGADQPFPENPDERIGRLVQPDEGARADAESEEVAVDVGTDLGGFSAEEAAMHVEPG